MSSTVEYKSNGTIKVSKPNRGQTVLRWLLIGSFIFTIVGFFLMDYTGLDLTRAIPKIGRASCRERV